VNFIILRNAIVPYKELTIIRLARLIGEFRD